MSYEATVCRIRVDVDPKWPFGVMAIDMETGKPVPEVSVGASLGDGRFEAIERMRTLAIGEAYEVTQFLLNEKGQKYLDGDGDRPASRSLCLLRVE